MIKFTLFSIKVIVTLRLVDLTILKFAVKDIEFGQRLKDGVTIVLGAGDTVSREIKNLKLLKALELLNFVQGLNLVVSYFEDA